MEEKKSRYNPDPVGDGELVTCEWGCGGQAKFRFKNGRVCCQKAYQRCEGARRKLVEKMHIVGNDGLSQYQRNGYAGVKSRKKVGEDGLTSYQRGGIKCSKSHLVLESNGKTKAANFSQKSAITMKSVGEDGLTTFQRAAAKTLEKRSLVGEDGMNSYQRYGHKAYQSSVESGARQAWVDRSRSDLDENGMNAFNRAGKKAHANAERGQDGLTSFERAVQRRVRDVDESGLNSFERAMLKAAWIQRYQDTDLYYQGNDELWFLDNLVSLYGKCWLVSNVTRGPTIGYIDPISGKNRRYLSDFIIGNIVYEIKSSWTWGSKGNSERQLQKLLINRAKLDATLARGYEVILVLDRKEIEYA